MLSLNSHFCIKSVIVLDVYLLVRLVLANSSDPVQRSSAHRAFVTALPTSQNTRGLPLACLQSHVIR
jgi:hypothetical protein